MWLCADERLPFYQDKLHEPVLYARFQEILQKVSLLSPESQEIDVRREQIRAQTSRKQSSTSSKRYVMRFISGSLANLRYWQNIKRKALKIKHSKPTSSRRQKQQRNVLPSEVPLPRHDVQGEARQTRRRRKKRKMWKSLSREQRPRRLRSKRRRLR